MMDWSLIIGVGIGFLGSLIVQVVSQWYQSKEGKRERKHQREMALQHERLRIIIEKAPQLSRFVEEAAREVESLITSEWLSELVEITSSLYLVCSEKTRLLIADIHIHSLEIVAKKHSIDEQSKRISTMATEVQTLHRLLHEELGMSPPPSVPTE